MKILSPRRFILIVLLAVASVGRPVQAQSLFESLFDFLSTFDFDALLEGLCPAIGPVLEGFGVSLPFCDGSGTDDDAPTDDAPTDDNAPAPAPTKKKEKVIVGTTAPVAPPSLAP